MKWCDQGLMAMPGFYGLCLSEVAFERELRRMRLPRGSWPSFMKTERANATTHFFEFEGKGIAIVTMAGWQSRDPIEVAGLLVHEAVHIWQDFHESIGETRPSPEFEAYSIQWISQQLMGAFREQSKRFVKTGAKSAPKV